MISHDYWLGAFVHSVGTRGKGSCLGQQIRRCKRCACTDDHIDRDLMGLEGYLFLGIWFVYSICWVTLVLRSSGADFFFEFFWEDTNVILCIFWGEFWFSDNVSVWLLMLYIDPGIWAFDAVIYLGVGFLTDSIREILAIFRWRNFDFILWILNFGHLFKDMLVKQGTYFSVGINVSEIGTAIKAGVQAGGIKDLLLAVCLISSMSM